MRVLLTGERGFIGSALKEELNGHRVATLPIGQRLPTSVTLFPGMVFFNDAILHLACDTLGGFSSNIAGTAALVQEAREGARFIFASTLTAQRPVDIYDQNKQLAEQIVLARPDIHAVILRLGWVYGPGKPNKRTALNAIMRQALRGDDLETYGNAFGIRDAVHLSDVVQAFVLALEAPPGVYDVGTSTGVSLVAAAQEVARQTGVRCGVSPTATDIHHPIALEQNWLPGWAPTISLSDGITQTLDWLRTTEPRKVAAA